MTLEVPPRGFVFWPVNNGDSTTVMVDPEIVMQIDINHTSSSEEEDDPKTPVIDRLQALLPRNGKRPYLSVFALTHPDQDHCRGFAELLERVEIGELWFTPRIFREFKKDLNDHALAFRDEAMRRVKATIRAFGDAGSGNRVRIIGYDTLLSETDFKGFPRERLTIPGQAIDELDGTAVGDRFRAFVHAPFKDDASADRNDTSLALQVTLWQGTIPGCVLFFGDLKYPTLKRILDVSNAPDLYWNALLAPHHCSKSAMYWPNDGEQEETLQDGILKKIGQRAGSPAYIISSSKPFPARNKPGDDPPHLIARERYEEIVPNMLLCTGEHGDQDAPTPIILAVTEQGVKYLGDDEANSRWTGITIGALVNSTRGTYKQPTEAVGFGRVVK
jgi:hypothetical protein